MDCRLSGLAEAAGAEYTRYADDLAFSGDAKFEKQLAWFSSSVAAVLHEEGYEVNHQKTRVMRSSVQQRLTGLVVNAKTNVPRADFDRLKAILTNCGRLGPESQNRQAHQTFRSHLQGRIGFIGMVNPEKARRLWTVFDKIQW